MKRSVFSLQSEQDRARLVKYLRDIEEAKHIVAKLLNVTMADVFEGNPSEKALRGSVIDRIYKWSNSDLEEFLTVQVQSSIVLLITEGFSVSSQELRRKAREDLRLSINLSETEHSTEVVDAALFLVFSQLACLMETLLSDGSGDDFANLLQ